MPMKSAFARGSRKRTRANDVAGVSAGNPKRASANGWRGTCSSGPEISSTSVSQLRACGAKVLLPALAVGAERAHRLGERPIEHAGRAVVERMRERELGVRELEPVTGEVERRKRGEPAASGWIAEHTSWR